MEPSAGPPRVHDRGGASTAEEALDLPLEEVHAEVRLNDAHKRTEGGETRVVVFSLDGTTYVHHRVVIPKGVNVVARIHTAVDDHIFDLTKDDADAMGTIRAMLADTSSDQLLNSDIDAAAIVEGAVPVTNGLITAERLATVRLLLVLYCIESLRSPFRWVVTDSHLCATFSDGGV